MQHRAFGGCAVSKIPDPISYAATWSDEQLQKQRAHLQNGGACPLASSVVSLAVPSRVGDWTDSYLRLWQDDAKLALTYFLFALRTPTAPPRVASRAGLTIVDHAPGARPRH